MAHKSAWSRLQDHFHQHPKGRRHEIAFWIGLGVLTGAIALVGWRAGVIAVPIALILAVVAICLAGWGLLPPVPQQGPPPKPGRLRNRR